MISRLGQVSVPQMSAATAATARHGEFTVRRELPVPAEVEPTGPLRSPSPSPSPAGTEMLAELIEERRSIDRAMARARRGDSFSPQELLALQMRVHDHALAVETAARVVGKTTEAVRTAMQQQ